MDVVEVRRTRLPSPPGPAGSRWWVLTLAGAGAFWSANLLVSLTPIAADYRSALSIPYLTMLLEAAVGGLVVAGVVARLVIRFPGSIPGAGPLAKALSVAAGALVVLTLLIEVPSKLGSGVDDPGRWMLTATLFNTIRILALALAIGLLARAGEVRGNGDRPVTREEKP